VSKFIIEIPNEKAATYKVVTLIVLLLNFFVFGFVFMHAVAGSSQIAAIAGLACNGIAIVYYLLNKKHLKTPYTEIIFFINAVLWLLWANYIVAGLMIVFSLLSFYANKKIQISFTDDEIIYPSFPVKKYAWDEVENVIWKDDILTIDLKNNKLLQFNIDKAFAAGFDAVGFNAFAAQKVGNPAC
jgi:hypothetical protein